MWIYGVDVARLRLATSIIVSAALVGAAVFGVALTGSHTSTVKFTSAVQSPAAQQQAGSTLPRLTEIPADSGSHGYPYDAVPTVAAAPDAPTVNLASYGYAQREFQLTGATNIYQQKGTWGTDGRWDVSVAQSNVPYTTRMIVRYPTDPAKFNGTVVVEWLNVTTGGDQDPVWSEMYQQILSQGYAYVGVTAQTAGMQELKAWDSQRYGALGDSGDGQSYDIFTQAAKAVRADSATLLGGLTPAKVIGVGDSQSAFRLVTYVNAIQPLTHAFDAFLAVGRSGFPAPIGSGLVSAGPFPALIRTDNTTPFIQLNMQADLTGLLASASRQPDNNYLRTWEVPGASHIDLHEALYEGNTIVQEKPQFALPECASGVVVDGTTMPDNMGNYELEDAALAALRNWLVNGTQPAHAHPVSSASDQYGNALGGVRLPDIQVPTETYEVSNSLQSSQSSPSTLDTLEDIYTAEETGAIPADLLDEGLCLMEGYYQPFSTATLQALYPTHADYVARYKAAAATDLKAGFLTQADYDTSVAAAEASAIP
jgi:hypothetical protein